MNSLGSAIVDRHFPHAETNASYPSCHVRHPWRCMISLSRSRCGCLLIFRGLGVPHSKSETAQWDKGGFQCSSPKGQSLADGDRVKVFGNGAVRNTLSRSPRKNWKRAPQTTHHGVGKGSNKTALVTREIKRSLVFSLGHCS